MRDPGNEVVTAPLDPSVATTNLPNTSPVLQHQLSPVFKT